MAEETAVLEASLRGRMRAPDEPDDDAESRHAGPSKRPARSAFRAFREIVKFLRGANCRVLLLDFDGTLAGIRRRPEDVRAPRKVKQLLERLAKLPNTSVAILSGRKANDLKRLLGLEGISYMGLHGSEGAGNAQPVAREARRALGAAKRMARREMRELPGVEVEDKGMGFSVHYRGARRATAQVANQRLASIVAPWRASLHVLHGKKVWEVLPRQILGKEAAARRVMAGSPPGSALLYIGDDAPDEGVFAEMASHVTVHVGENHETNARYRLRNPGEVARFLSLLEKELR